MRDLVGKRWVDAIFLIFSTRQWAAADRYDVVSKETKVVQYSRSAGYTEASLHTAASTNAFVVIVF